VVQTLVEVPCQINEQAPSKVESQQNPNPSSALEPVSHLM